ncbi:hypothetical protein [Niveispirillum fermenti]|uniref:hypothetical protein n=1 Tax=Niveispirillum fermenti TaxID=1233113 RepID=UPI003A83B970
MYNDDDLDAAVAAGVLSRQNVEGLRHFMATRRADQQGGEHERFRLLTGFNDIFVSVGVVLILAAVGFLGGRVHGALGAAGIAAASWLLAEYFTRRLRLSLTSIVLLLGFASGLLIATLTGLLDLFGLKNISSPLDATGAAAVAAIVACVGVWLHWRRFMVPVTVAAGTAIGLLALLALLLTLAPSLKEMLLVLVLAAGLAMFAVAMYWDGQDRGRQTRRSDVAFWLHLSAAPLIIHPVFSWVGVNGAVQAVDPGLALVTCIGTYVALGLVSLAIDRRAMLVSALVYVIYALMGLFSMAGAANEVTFALAALVIGSGLLLLSARWDAARRLLVGHMPSGLQGLLPVVR